MASLSITKIIYATVGVAVYEDFNEGEELDAGEVDGEAIEGDDNRGDREDEKEVVGMH